MAASVAWWPEGAEACQVCFGGGASVDTLRGFFWGFVVLIVSVFVALGGLTIMIVRGVRAPGLQKESPYQSIQ